MKLYHLLIHLFEENSLEDVLTALTSLGIDNAVALDGQRMSRLLAFDVPIFAGFREDVSDRSSYCKALSAVIDDPDAVDQLVLMLRDAGVDFEKEGTGVIMLFPIERAIGYSED